MKPTQIDFKKNNGLVPVVIQDDTTGVVYMVGYMNEVSYKKTIETQYVYFWSRSRNALWKKGEVSGNMLKVVYIQMDCDGDTLLMRVALEGTVVCHTGSKSCFRYELFKTI
ncbi:MAG: phosphoribosyl-AMP cyclohydrolase [Microgenomates group bacterium]